jgi:outer membrane lipase/esterase
MVLGTVAALSLAQASHAAITNIVSFGDSLSDTGNIFTATSGAVPAAPYFDGNFSNGDIWIEYLAADLGIAAPTASNVGGTNLAWGGARTTLAGSTGQPSAQTQVLGYLSATGGVADPNALYTIMIGGNDINAFDGVSYGTTELALDGQVVASLANSLISAGAQSILILNVPDVGTAPIADGNEALVTSLTSLYNGNLAAAVAGLDASKVALVDAFALTQDIATNPGTY